MSADRDAIIRRIEGDVDRVVRARHEAIEAVCEMALAGGAYGVAVYDDVAVVDPDVPYGMIHHHPGVNAPKAAR